MEIEMALESRSTGALVLRLIVGLALLGCPRVGSAQGRWSVISLPQKPGELSAPPDALAVDAAGNLYVAENWYDGDYNSRIQKRDAQGNWLVIATRGTAVGQVGYTGALAVDIAGNLYVADYQLDLATGKYGNYRIQKRDPHGNWSVLATQGTALGQVSNPLALAVDGAGNLYVADYVNNRVLKYTPAP
jgi:sugar lactone lactonase YvrE